ncbi:hypothetical protein CYG68_03640 [Morganella morganii]|uniref:Uncharacterized protein n=1 Tax=Morganella morganii TaxID=582 RepID=A0A8I0PUQ1_MORMO|nr:hypothetical protein [Morganella morganii]MBE8611507.1 hypothetical protein [Morganella morganii]
MKDNEIKNDKIAFVNEWDLPAMTRLLKEQKRLGLSDKFMADSLELSEYHFSLVAEEKPDFKMHMLPNEMLRRLYEAGIDLFYVMTGETKGSDNALKWSAFEYAIADLPLDEQDALRGLIEDMPKGYEH